MSTLNNVSLRIITAISFLLVVLASVYFGNEVFSALFFVLIAICGFEWARLSGLSKTKSILYTGAVICIMILALLDFGNIIFYVMAGLTPILLVLSWKSPQFYVLTGVIYLPFVAISIQAIVEFYGRVHGAWFAPIIFLWGLVITNDIFAYYVGKAFGKKKLAKTISPNKTIEGLFGGVFMAGVFGASYGYIIEENMSGALALGFSAAILGVVAQFGDLYISKIKRVAGKKDSGVVLPGHGGMLDRLDGLLAVVAVSSVIFTIVFTLEMNK